MRLTSIQETRRQVSGLKQVQRNPGFEEDLTNLAQKDCEWSLIDPEKQEMGQTRKCLGKGSRNYGRRKILVQNSDPKTGSPIPREMVPVVS